jgi:hypothetical protein
MAFHQHRPIGQNGRPGKLSPKENEYVLKAIEEQLSVGIYPSLSWIITLVFS